jgi:peptidoglycan/xylan/chitin deacetylase (PgdA/CDA1 family)
VGTVATSEEYWTNNPPSNLVVTWVDDYAALTWDISDAKGAYEIWENKDDEGYVLVDTTEAGATSYANYTFQNAAMDFKIRGVRSGDDGYLSEVSLTTPIVLKTNQATLNTVTFNRISPKEGTTLTIDWGDATATQDITANTTNIAHNYGGVGQYFIKLTGAFSTLSYFYIYSQTKISADISKWKFPGNDGVNAFVRIDGCGFTGDLSDMILPPTLSTFSIYNNNITGLFPENSSGVEATAIDWTMNRCKFTGVKTTLFEKGMRTFDISRSNAIISNSALDTFLKNMADHYDTNAPMGSYNPSIQLWGDLLGVPTGGDTNTDIVRIKQAFTKEGATATITINSRQVFDNGKLVLSVDGNVDSLRTITVPLLLSKGVTCTMFTTSGHGGYTMEQAKAMYDLGMDIQCHTATHPDLEGLSEAELIAELEAQNTAFSAVGIPSPIHFAYPFGSGDADTIPIISKYRLTARDYFIVPSVYYPLYGDVDKYNIPGFKIDEEIINDEDYRDIVKERILWTKEQKGALSVMWHGNTEEYIHNLEEIIDYAVSVGVDIINISELYALLDVNYCVAFEVSDAVGRLEDAEIVINGETLTTTANGFAYIYLSPETYAYEISLAGYVTQNSSIVVDTTNKYIQITLVAT